MIYTDIPPAAPPKQALVHMVESRYGFSLVDTGLSDEDLMVLQQFVLTRSCGYHFFCGLEDFQSRLLDVLIDMNGCSDQKDPGLVAGIIYKIAKQVLFASDRKVAWFCLRSALPPDPIALKRWHMDGRHYRTEDIQYKFCMTLKGPATRFYLLPIEHKNLRRVIWRHMDDVKFTNEFCSPEKMFCQNKKEGVFFLMAHPDYAAFHADPEVVEPRLFFSMVPCHPEQLADVRYRIELYSPASDKDIYINFKSFSGQ